MAKIPLSPQEITMDFAADVKEIYGDELIAVILYGSGAAGTYVPKKSDINFLIVLTPTGIEKLSRCFPLLEKWRPRNVAVPLIVTQEYIINSLDSFPIEFFNMQKNYQVIYGQDVLGNLHIPKEHLRLELEEQIKGKLLHLRSAFLATLGRKRQLYQLIRISLPTFAALFPALLALKDLPAPSKREDIFIATADAFQLDYGLFKQLFDVADKRLKLSADQLIKLVESYIMEIRKLAFIIDELK